MQKCIRHCTFIQIIQSDGNHQHADEKTPLTPLKYHCGTNKTCVFPQLPILSGLQPLQEGRVDPPHPSQTPRSRLSPSCRCGPVTIPDWGADGDTAEETPSDGVEPEVKPAAVCTFSVSGSAPAPSSARPSKARPPDVHSRPFFFFCCLNTPPIIYVFIQINT